MMSGTPEGIETEHVASRLRAAREVAGKTQQEARRVLWQVRK